MQVPLHRSVHWHRQLGTHTKLNALSTILLLANVYAYSSLIHAPWCPPPIHPPICSPSPPCPPLPLCSKACAPPCPWPLPHSPQAYPHPSPGALHLFWPLYITHAPSGPRKLVWTQKCAPSWSVGPHFSECGSICLYFPTPYRIT